MIDHDHEARTMICEMANACSLADECHHAFPHDEVLEEDGSGICGPDNCTEFQDAKCVPTEGCLTVQEPTYDRLASTPCALGDRLPIDMLPELVGVSLTGAKNPVSSRYSGDGSRDFWDRVNALGTRRSELQSLGVVLQNIEAFVLDRLDEAEAEVRKQ